jgi:hypothetical protein
VIIAVEIEHKMIASNAGSKEKSRSIIPPWLILLVIGVGTLTLVMLTLYVKTFGTELSNKQDVWGQFGDFFGGILNPLLSSLALAAVLVTLRVQSQDLKAAQEDNKQTNKHLNDQAKYIRLQSFESVFFRLLDLHLNAKKEFTFITGGTINKGLSGFESAGSELSEFESTTLTATDAKDDQSCNIETITIKFEEKFGTLFSTYFRSMYQILKYVDTYTGFRNEPPHKNTPTNHAEKVTNTDLDLYTQEYKTKRQYINMLRAQMEQVEKRALFASCLTAKGAGLKFYVEKYSLLKGINISRMSLTEKQAHAFYDSSAFYGHEDIDYATLKANDNKQPF